MLPFDPKVAMSVARGRLPHLAGDDYALGEFVNAFVEGAEWQSQQPLPATPGVKEVVEKIRANKGLDLIDGVMQVRYNLTDTQAAALIQSLIHKETEGLMLESARLRNALTTIRHYYGFLASPDYDVLLKEHLKDFVDKALRSTPSETEVGDV